ncbi:MAG: hypothetical protein F6J95_027495 [Leptolyngbya sp. SIO1E4]|nr:hypothetical protein [Leptolyngbya sp. SIO1E4]
MTTHYFIKTNFDSAQLARQAPDELVQQLIAQGLNCHALTLLRATDGDRIFAIEVNQLELPLEDTPTKPRRRTIRSRDRSTPQVAIR